MFATLQSSSKLLQKPPLKKEKIDGLDCIVATNTMQGQHVIASVLNLEKGSLKKTSHVNWLFDKGMHQTKAVSGTQLVKVKTTIALDLGDGQKEEITMETEVIHARLFCVNGTEC